MISNINSEYEYNFEYRDLTARIPFADDLLKKASKEFRVIPYEITGLVRYSYHLAKQFSRIKENNFELLNKLENEIMIALLKVEEMWENYLKAKIYIEHNIGNINEMVKQNMFLKVNNLEV